MLRRLLSRATAVCEAQSSQGLLSGVEPAPWHSLLMGPCPHRTQVPCSSSSQLQLCHGRGIHSSSGGAWFQHSSPAEAAQGEGAPSSSDQDLNTPPNVHLFVSQTQHWHGPREGTPLAASHTAANPRLIYFPNLSLQMLPLPPEELQQLKEFGWVREAAFRTQPHVTKLEIKAYLESVYGMSVERVHTINYLGRKHAVRPMKPRASKKIGSVVLREDDWKKAYVIFKNPPADMPLPPAPAPESPLDMLAALRRVKLARGQAGRRRKPHICPRTGQLLFAPLVLDIEGIEEVTAFPKLDKDEGKAQVQQQEAQQASSPPASPPSANAS